MSFGTNFQSYIGIGFVKFSLSSKISDTYCKTFDIQRQKYCITLSNRVTHMMLMQTLFWVITLICYNEYKYKALLFILVCDLVWDVDVGF